MGTAYWLALTGAWLVGSLGCGAALAWLYRRLYPSLAFYKLWALWTLLLSVTAALILWLG